jgi:mediator of RNA polymerase II transcription subunit 16
VSALTGSVRWTLDLMSWIIDTLLELPKTLPDTPALDLKNASTLSLPELLTHLRSTNTISLHLLLSSTTRGFLNALCRRLTNVDYIARKAISHTSQGYTSASST